MINTINEMEKVLNNKRTELKQLEFDKEDLVVKLCGVQKLLVYKNDEILNIQSEVKRLHEITYGTKLQGYDNGCAITSSPSSKEQALAGQGINRSNNQG